MGDSIQISKGVLSLLALAVSVASVVMGGITGWVTVQATLAAQGEKQKSVIRRLHTLEGTHERDVNAIHGKLDATAREYRLDVKTLRADIREIDVKLTRIETTLEKGR